MLGFYVAIEHKNGLGKGAKKICPNIFHLTEYSRSRQISHNI